MFEIRRETVANSRLRDMAEGVSQRGAREIGRTLELFPLQW